MRYLTVFVLVLLVSFPVVAAAGEASVRETTLTIPTYRLGPEDKNPPLWNPNVYPYPMQTAITGQKVPKKYRAVILENDLIRVIMLPDVGGRIYAAHDKTNRDFDFIYHNHVIKPGLVALRGAWLSGGIEWNFPTRGHTVHTVSPVQYKILKNANGSVTCTVGTTEWVRRMRWMVTVTVFPDRSCFELRILLFNPTLTHNNGYFWANAAVHAWPDTRVTFPPADHTYAGMRRDPRSWPMYRGKDNSWYKTTPYPFDYFCGTPGDYQGAYNYRRDCGSVHCALRHDAFGKKFWTWGTAPNGMLWEDILTDEDGQYIEVQSGRLLTQGDTWIFEPHLQESWKEYWYPIKRMKGFVKANPDAAVNFAPHGDKLLLALNTTKRFEDATIRLLADDREVFRQKLSVRPTGAWQKEIDSPGKRKSCRLVFEDNQGRQIITYSPPKEKVPPPELEPEFPPVEKATVEEIYLKGHYTMKHWNLAGAVELFQQALKRDPGYTPALRALAIVYYKTGRFTEARELAKKVLRRNEDDHTARYYRVLGRIKTSVAERLVEDLDLIGRRAAYRHVVPYVQASLAVEQGNLGRVEQLLRRAIRENPGDLKARAVLAAILRHLGRRDDAVRLVDRVLAEDPLNGLAAVEKALLGDASQLAVLRDNPQHYLEAACDYMEMNLYQDSVAALKLFQGRTGTPKHPLVYFYLGYLADKMQKGDLAKSLYAQGVRLPPDYVFPFRTESEAVLKTGLRYRPDDWKLHYYLGTLLAAKLRWREGLDHLLAAEKSEPEYPVLYYDLAEIYWHKLHDREKAAAAYQEAIEYNPDDYNYYVALDRLYSTMGRQQERDKLFEAAPRAVRKDFRVLLRRATYYVDVGQADQALDVLRRNKFHPWEGWTGAHQVYVRALHQRADKRVKEGQYEKAVDDLRRAMEYPENLGTGKPHDPNYVQEYCKLGICYQALGKQDHARENFAKAAGRTGVLSTDDQKWRARAKAELDKLK